MKVLLRVQTNSVISELCINANTTVTLGRTGRATHTIPDDLISGTHCKIIFHPPQLQIIDLDSKNGTYINGLRIEQSDVFVGDEITIGSTKIAILSEKMDPQSIQALTFPGLPKDRAAHGLQLDFAGARMINQGHSGLQVGDNRPTSTGNKDLEVRKKAQSKIKLSKQEIKLRNKKATSLSATLDTIFFFASVALPLVITNVLIMANPALIKNNRLMVMGVSVVVGLTLFYFINFRLLKFTLGEKFAGIQKLYEKQD